MNKTRKLTGLALLTAIVFALQFLAVVIPIRVGPFSVSLVLLPIVLGAALYGPAAAAWLGLVFSLAVLFSGDAGPFMAVNPLGAIFTVIAKGVAAGFVGGLVYRLFEKKNRYFATVAAAVITPFTNTFIFILGCLAFFMETIEGWAGASGYEGSAVSFIVFGMIGLNFIFEILTNAILSPTVLRLINYRKKDKP
ncbi:MAG: ECF transporter S component [Candidatus Scatomorpha sp.]